MDDLLGGWAAGTSDDRSILPHCRRPRGILDVQTSTREGSFTHLIITRESSATAIDDGQASCTPPLSLSQIVEAVA
jgi:hypothetical protein